MACKRCPLRRLLTPFWSPIKHLFLYYLITNWFHVCYKPAFYVFVYHYLLMFCLKVCNDFSKCYLNLWSIKKKRFSLPEDDNGIDSLGMLGVVCWWCEFRGVGCWLMGVDEMIGWLIKIVNNMSWYFYMLFTVFKWLKSWFLDAFYS